MKSRERIGNGTLLVTDGELKYIEFESLNKYGDRLVHLMSTRIGGVSTGECAALNLGFNRNDSRENVYENYSRLCESAGIDRQSLVVSNQVHGKCIRAVDKNDMGKGFTKKNDIKDADGLMTTAAGITLVTHHADCVPVYLYEPGIHAAALLHSGWRGTLKSIVSGAVDRLSELPGFRADRLLAVIGPSIRSCCFEVEKDVYSLFREKYREAGLYAQLGGGKWSIDLQGIIKADLIKHGLDEKNIHDCEICTKCNRDLFFSYRGDAGRTGSLAAFLQLK